MTRYLRQRILRCVSEIPPGQVATFGDIAKKVGISDARIVAQAISGNKDPKIPCHRLVKFNGSLNTNYSKGDWRDDKILLEQEGVKFIDDKTVDLKNFRKNFNSFP